MVDINRMNVYYRRMRHKDENKSERIFNASIQLINELGLSEASMSKIAKKPVYLLRRFTYTLKIRRIC